MTYVAILLVMFVAFTLVGWPLIGPARSSGHESDDGSAWSDLVGRRDAAYRSIKELDFEYELGNLSDADYQRLRQRYRRDAAATLRKLDVAASGSTGAPAAGAGASPAEAPTAPLPSGLICPSCAAPVEAGDRYCWSCGAQQGSRCASCGSLVEAGHRFCPGCGDPLKEVA